MLMNFRFFKVLNSFISEQNSKSRDQNIHKFKVKYNSSLGDFITILSLKIYYVNELLN